MNNEKYMVMFFEKKKKNQLAPRTRPHVHFSVFEKRPDG